MPNPQLNESQHKQAQKLLVKIRKEINILAQNRPKLIFAFRRKIYKELTYDERGTPASRKRLKKEMFAKQKGLCLSCGKELPSRGSILDRKLAWKGYFAKGNVELICPYCDKSRQEVRHFK